MVFVRVMVPIFRVNEAATRQSAWLWTKVELAIVTVPLGDARRREAIGEATTRNCAALPSKVVRVIVTVPVVVEEAAAIALHCSWLKMQSMRVSVPLLKMPPPTDKTRRTPLRRVSLCRVSVPAAATFRMRNPGRCVPLDDGGFSVPSLDG